MHGRVKIQPRAAPRAGEMIAGPAQLALDDRLALAQFALGWDAARFAASAHEQEPDRFSAVYETLVSRRERREPLAYITGHREFWGLEIEVSRAVLIPHEAARAAYEVFVPLGTSARGRWPRSSQAPD